MVGGERIVSGGVRTVGKAGAANEVRMRRRLWADDEALTELRTTGLSEATIRHFRLGLNEVHAQRDGRVTERALAIPMLRVDGSRSGRWSFLALEVTSDAPHPVAWTPGGARSLFSAPAREGSPLVVVSSPMDVFLLWQVLGSMPAAPVILSSSVPDEMPVEWRDDAFWRPWSDVVVSAAIGTDLTTRIAQAAGRGLRRCPLPDDETFADMVRQGASAAEIKRLLDRAGAWTADVVPATSSSDRLVGDFHADPVAIEGALIRGLLHHPVMIERRELQERPAGGAVMVQRYVTRVLRSDGRLLDIVRLPAPIGTPSNERVLALSDGTRIDAVPQPSRFASWRFPSIMRFIEDRAADREPARRRLPRLLADIETHIRGSVWLPHDHDYALLSLFVAGTFVHRVFDAFPILMVNGPKGSGKSELGQALAGVACNAVVAGRITSAGLVRLLAESRGTVVLDDLEAVSASRSGIDDLSQILKVSYKASTARRIQPGRDGRIEVLDFFGPKVVSNIGGCDPVLSSRTLQIAMRPVPADAEIDAGLIDCADLRDELHVWAMCDVGLVSEAYRPLAAAARDRRAEIAAPLRALAEVAGGSWAGRLSEALATGPQVVEPVDAVLSRALRRLVAEEGVIELAMPRLALEMAAQARGPLEMPSAESLGRMLLALGARDRTGEVERRRLHGEVTRVYRLSDSFLHEVGAGGAADDAPFSFCSGACSACRYDAVCKDAVPWLKPARAGRSRS